MRLALKITASKRMTVRVSRLNRTVVGAEALVVASGGCGGLAHEPSAGLCGLA